MNHISFSSGEADWSGLRVLVLSPTPTHPQDFGNRKRVYALCENLKTRGAKIVFVHYPAEADWRSHIPEHATARMARSWDGFYTVPVTRDLHPDSLGDTHTIDEWWDESIGEFLSWLFHVQKFDVFIVNYTWLSKAFEFAPESVTKILDTHDRFSGRKKLFRQHGLRPEFFYTTEKEEAKAFARADIVWAIKDQERALFEKITSTPILTLLHLDKTKASARPPRDPLGYLRVGIIGARNSVNAANLWEFLEEAIPVFERNFAPIRLLIAGSVCTMLDNIDSRFVSLMGETPNAATFYGAIDVACVPVAFSTGLKIKVAEAISHHCPVISLAHAFEGFPPQHPSHTLVDFRELADKLVELSFSPELLRELETASGRVQKAVRRSIDNCLRSTRQIVQRKTRTLLYCVDAKAFETKGCLRAIMASATCYMANQISLVVTIVSGSLAWLPRTAPAMEGDTRVAIALEIGENKYSPDGLRSRGFEVAPFASLVSRFRPELIVVDAVHDCLRTADFSDTTVVYRPAIAAQSAIREFHAVHFAKGAKRRYVMGTRMSGDLEALARAGEADPLLSCCFWGQVGPEEKRVERRNGRRPLAAVLDAGRLIGCDAVLELMARLDCEILHVHPGPIGSQPTGQQIAPSLFCDQLADPMHPPPDFALDISFGALELQLARELLDRCGVCVVNAESVVSQPSISGFSPPGRPKTAHELFAALVLAVRGEYRAFTARP